MATKATTERLLTDAVMDNSMLRTKNRTLEGELVVADTQRQFWYEECITAEREMFYALHREEIAWSRVRAVKWVLGIGLGVILLVLITAA